MQCMSDMWNGFSLTHFTGPATCCSDGTYELLELLAYGLFELFTVLKI